MVVVLFVVAHIRRVSDGGGGNFQSSGKWGDTVDVVVGGRDETTGARIAQHRKLRGLTQRGLAMRANVSYSTLTKVESGHAIASPAVLAAVARALSVNVAQITGQPFLNELRTAKVDQLIEPLRVALDSFDLAPSGDVTPRPVADIAAATKRLCDEAMCNGMATKGATELPGLLGELTVVLAEHDDDPMAWRTLAAAYRCCRHVVLNWGFRDLADIALERATWAGAQGGDPLADAVRQRARASNHLRAGSYDTGQQLLDATLRIVDDAPPSDRNLVLAGHTHLGWAVNRARDGHLDAAREHLDAAEHLAGLTGEAPTLDWFGFGPTNVAVHRVAILIEAGRYHDGIAAADGLTLPADWPPTRAAHHHMDLGRAYAAVGQHDEALNVLREARRLAPEQTRFHPTTRQAIEHLLTIKRSVPQLLATYARWVGL